MRPRKTLDNSISKTEWVNYFKEIYRLTVQDSEVEQQVNGSLLYSDKLDHEIVIITINTFTARVVGAPQMILQPVFSIFPCSPLPSGTCRIPGLSIPWCCLSTSSFVRLVIFPLSLCLARWFWPDLMNGKHDHTTAVCVILRSSGDLHVVQLPAGSWH